MTRPSLHSQETIDKFVKSGYWNETTPWSIWDKNASDYPDKEAVVDSRTRLTWSQAKIWTDRVALGFVELGIKRDDVIAVQLPNCVEICCLRIACGKAGALGMGVLPNLRQKEMEHVLQKTEAVGIVIPWRFRDFDYFKMIQEIRGNLPALRHIFVVDDRIPPGAISLRDMACRSTGYQYSPEVFKEISLPATEVSCLALTTGTTGLPKFVEVPLATRMNLDRTLTKIFEARSDDVVVTFSPAYGGPNLAAYWVASMVGAKIVALEHFEAEHALRLIEKEKGTIVCVAPAHLNAILRCPNLGKYKLTSVRLWASAGALLPYETAVEVEERIGGVVLTCYGSTEWGGLCTNPLYASREVRLLTVGKPLAGDEVKIVGEDGNEVAHGEVGEVLVKGPCCNSGYYKDPESTAETWTADGWLKMGDLGKIDSRGNLVIVGRRKDMIIRGGQNIYPIEIENMLLAHPKVANVAVVGMPDSYLGERACAFVVPKAGETFGFEEMVAFLKKENIAPYKLPERLEIIDAIPLCGEQKADKKRLAADIARKLRVTGSEAQG